MLTTIIQNWKTSVAGVVLLALAAGFLMGKISLDQFTAFAAVIAGGGLLASKDGSNSR